MRILIKLLIICVQGAEDRNFNTMFVCAILYHNAGIGAK